MFSFSTKGVANASSRRPPWQAASRTTKETRRKRLSMRTADLRTHLCRAATFLLLILLYIPPISLDAAVDNSSVSVMMNNTLPADAPPSNSSLLQPTPSTTSTTTTTTTTSSSATPSPSSSSSSTPLASSSSASPPVSSSPSSSSSFHSKDRNRYKFHAIAVAPPHRCFKTTEKPPPSPSADDVVVVYDADEENPAASSSSSSSSAAPCGDSEDDACCYNDAITSSFPNNPLLPCDFLPSEFIECDEPVDHKKNYTARDELGHGCAQWGGEKWEDVEKTKVVCRALDGIECSGRRVFFRGGYPCIRYSGHYFVTTLLYSILLGFLGMDRFCLGHMGSGVGKLLTIGGLGIWWLVDIVLLVQGVLKPVDDSNWEPLF